MTPLPQIPFNQSIKTRFTYRFLQALKELKYNNKNGSSSSKADEIYQRFHGVKYASNASMAGAVGSKRAWSRAILCKIRNSNMRRRRNIHALIKKRRGDIFGNPKMMRENCCGKSKAKELRKVVPGGEDMEIGRLFDETANYIKCLNIQVQVMKNILSFYSPN